MSQEKKDAQKHKPTTLVIFGATGDLSQRYLIPAVFDLFMRGLLPENTRIVGFSRRDWTHEKFKSFVREALIEKGYSCAQESHPFFDHTFYVQGDLTEEQGYTNLATFLNESDDELGVCTNKIFHLSVSPRLYDTVFHKLSESGLTTPCADHRANEEEQTWTRVLVEKPFGKDRKEAQHLDQVLGSLFDESQIFRIDHYLAKETVQNILTFRFANSIFEPMWNKDHIEKVEIKIHESIDLGERGAFFNGVGALRDMGQSHILQLLALVAMEDPREMNPNKLREERTKVLEKVFVPEVSEKYITRGQYEGYRDIEDIPDDSQTETYFKLEAQVKNDRWKDVPFILENGKALDRRQTEITIYFKVVESCVCPPGDTEHQNVLRFIIQPKEEISIRFWTKKPGFGFELEPQEFAFDYAFEEDEAPEAYQRVIYDAFRGDQSLFASTDEVKAQWDLIMPVLDSWKELPLHIYKKGDAANQIGMNTD